MSSSLKQMEIRLADTFEILITRLLHVLKIRSRMNWVILSSYLFVLTGLSLIPMIRVQVPSLGRTILQNSVHLPLYFLLTLLFYNLYKSDEISWWRLVKHPVACSAVSAFWVGLGIEILQSYSPSREFSVVDMILNGAGIMYFVIGISLFNEFRWARKMETGAPSLLTAYHSCFFQEFEVLQDKLKILKSNNPGDHKVILIGSTHPREGKTTVMLSLAFALVQKEQQRVALVDLNLSNPQLHQIFGMTSNIGALELFQGSESIDLVVQPTMLKNLDVVTIGNRDLARNQGFYSVAVRQAIEQLRLRYEVVLVEMTPFSVPVRNAISIRLLTALADHALLIIQKDATDRKKIRESLKLFEGYESKIAGTVINNRLNVA